MTPPARKYLDDMLERARYLVELSTVRNLRDLESDRVLRSCVERELMVLGEALYLLHGDTPEIAEEIDAWRDIIAMRHKLVHGYSTVAPSILRDVIVNELPPLIVKLDELVADKS